MGSVFDGIMAGLTEVLAIVEGRAEPTRVYVPPKVDERDPAESDLTDVVHVVLPIPPSDDR